MSQEATYYKSVAPLIQWEGWLRRLIQKVDLEGWPKRLDKLSDRWLIRDQLQDNLWYKIVSIRLDPSCDQLCDLMTLLFILKKDIDFNYKIIINIMYQNQKFILYIIDIATIF